MATRSELLVGIGVAAIALAFLVGTETIRIEHAAARDVGSRFVPRLASGLMAALALVLIVSGLRAKTDAPLLDGRALAHVVGRVAPLVVLALLFVPAVELVGFPVAIAAATFAGLLLFGQRRIMVLLLVPAALTIVIDWVFFGLMALYRPPALLPGLALF